MKKEVWGADPSQIKTTEKFFKGILKTHSMCLSFILGKSKNGNLILMWKTLRPPLTRTKIDKVGEEGTLSSLAQGRELSHFYVPDSTHRHKLHNTVSNIVNKYQGLNLKCFSTSLVLDHWSPDSGYV